MTKDSKKQWEAWMKSEKDRIEPEKEVEGKQEEAEEEKLIRHRDAEEKQEEAEEGTDRGESHDTIGKHALTDMHGRWSWSYGLT